MHTGSMAYSDAILLDTLERLLELHGPDALISQARLAEATGMCAKTVYRALHRLREAGEIEGDFTHGIGYRYRITARRALLPGG
jgi:DNA-binding IclR family transcriptional regulator